VPFRLRWGFFETAFVWILGCVRCPIRSYYGNFGPGGVSVQKHIGYFYIGESGDFPDECLYETELTMADQ